MIAVTEIVCCAYCTVTMDWTSRISEAHTGQYYDDDDDDSGKRVFEDFRSSHSSSNNQIAASLSVALDSNG